MSKELGGGGIKEENTECWKSVDLPSWSIHDEDKLEDGLRVARIIQIIDTIVTTISLESVQATVTVRKVQVTTATGTATALATESAAVL
ncbi:unnamed protein product [Soboliphyme baturini]|uniref:Uncharacterized protein n=1 Tax=Soboliphyme baturini TaxID=241478 RepID=A0A183IWQ6_9BILA|nr:unnamed protein product [Soboliphyme baturini]